MIFRRIGEGSKWSVSEITVGLRRLMREHLRIRFGWRRVACRGGDFGLQALQKPQQGCAVELPVKRLRFAIRQFLVPVQTLFHFRQGGEIVGRQHLSLNDREVDLHLVEPTRMDWSMDHDCLAVGLPQATVRCLPAVRRAVIYYPEDSLVRSIRLGSHPLVTQPLAPTTPPLPFRSRPAPSPTSLP